MTNCIEVCYKEVNIQYQYDMMRYDTNSYNAAFRISDSSASQSDKYFAAGFLLCILSLLIYLFAYNLLQLFQKVILYNFHV